MIRPADQIEVKEWYTCDIPKKELKTFLKRDDYHASLHVGLWFFLLFASGYLAYRLIGTIWVIPAFLLYGIIFSGANARWHECSHGTPFKTNWLNEFVFFIAAAMEQRDIVHTRWEHALHHSYTIIPGVDLEILITRPPKFSHLLLDFFNLKSGPLFMKNTILHSFGIPSKMAKHCVPEEEYGRMFWWARATLMFYVIPVCFAIVMQSWLPLLYFVFPRFYGGFIQWVFILLQHGGLADNVWDHRLNTRTVYMNPVFGFLYMNMQYHIEHHIYPMVPFHALRKLHERIKDQTPKAYSSIWAAYREMVPVLLKQKKDPEYYIKREISAKVINA